MPTWMTTVACVLVLVVGVVRVWVALLDAVQGSPDRYDYTKGTEMNHEQGDDGRGGWSTVPLTAKDWAVLVLWFLFAVAVLWMLEESVSWLWRGLTGGAQ